MFYSFKKSIFIFLLICNINKITSNCPNNCNGHGLCDKYSRCICSPQFYGADCSLRVCPQGPAWNDLATGTDKAHNLAVCSNRGLCDTATGACTCAEGFTGHACERLDCFANCNANGKCVSMSNYATYYRDLNSQSFTYNNVWDSKKIHGCICDPQYRGYDCSLRVCSNGDDPLTTGQKNTIQLMRCIANKGTFVLFFKGKPSATIKYTDKASAVAAALLAIPYITNVKVTFSQSSSTVCSTDANIVSIEFIEQFGPQPPFVPKLDTEMSLSGQISISADGVTSFTDISGVTLVSVIGTKEADVCAFRGICSVADGTCLCFATNGDTYGSSNGYGLAGTRGDCGFITSGKTVSTCPGGVQCSGHGVCDSTKGTFRCSCSVGWGAGDCSERTCPTGRSWFSYPTTNEFAHFDNVECSNMGTCDSSTGTCVCRNGFFGNACQYLGCGGGTATPCNGHGKCLSMYELSLNSNNNGELMIDIDSTYLGYGNDPNNQYTWDGTRIFGCICDIGYGGYDCTEKTCPLGDDPGTYDDHNEVQLLKCVASSGTFTLTFRNYMTPPIPYSVTSSQLSSILSKLPSILKATVTFVQDGPPPIGTLQINQRPLDPIHYKPFELDQKLYNGQKFGNPLNFNQPVKDPTPISVTWNINNTQFCDTSGNQIAIIQFDRVTGNIPALRIDTSLLADVVNFNGLPGTGVISIAVDGASMTLNSPIPSGYNTTTIASVLGTTETAVCNNRGLCDKATGKI